MGSPDEECEDLSGAPENGRVRQAFLPDMQGWLIGGSSLYLYVIGSYSHLRRGAAGHSFNFSFFFVWIISCRCYKHLPGQRSCCQEGVVGEVDFVEQLLLPTFSVA